MTYKIKTAIALLVLAASSISFAQCPVIVHAEVPVISGKTYHDARSMLLKAGWQPVQTIHYNDSDNPNIAYGNGKLLWNKGYRELETCAGTGTAPCVFNFTDVYSNRLKVVTEGEEYPEYDAYATVSSYRFECI